MKHLPQKYAGFTLVEIILVIVVIGILASLAVTRYVPLQASARRAACLTNQRTIEQAQRLFYGRTSIDTGTGVYAETLEELAPLMKDESLPRCPDDFDYELLPNGGVRCASPDHQR